MHRGVFMEPTFPTTGAHLPTSIPAESAPGDRLRTSEAGVGELRHDLHEQHERWLIEQYLEGAGEA